MYGSSFRHMRSVHTRVFNSDKRSCLVNTSMVRDIPDVVAPIKTAETSEDAEGDEDEGEQPILGHVSMATDLVRV